MEKWPGVTWWLASVTNHVLKSNSSRMGDYPGSSDKSSHIYKRIQYLLNCTLPTVRKNLLKIIIQWLILPRSKKKKHLFFKIIFQIQFKSFYFKL